MNTEQKCWLWLALAPISLRLTKLFFGRFLGFEGVAVTPLEFILIFFAVLFLGTHLLLYLFRLEKNPPKKGLMAVLIHLFSILLSSLSFTFLSSLSFTLLSSLSFTWKLLEHLSSDGIIKQVTGIIKQVASNNSGVSSGWTEILGSENNPNISSEPSSNSEPSINQPGRNQPAANPNPPEENTRPVERFPYQPDEVIGGDSVNSIQQRFLSKKESPSKEDIDWARMKAEDHFEMKVDIIRRMAALHPEGDWLRRGARALDNNRTATGEHSLDQLGDFLRDLSENRERSRTFQQLKDKVFLRVEDIDENSGIH